MDLKIPYSPREWQIEASKALNRFTVLVLHRRAGKTVFDIVQNIAAVLGCDKPRPQGAYIAPNYGMAKRIAWDYYKEFLEPLRQKGLVQFHETALRIDFKSGAKIYLLGAEDPDSIRGMYMDHVILDEYQDMPADFFEKVIRPLLSDREGGAILTGTPKGKNQFFDMYNKGLDEEEKSWSSVLMTWKDTNALKETEVEDARRDMSEEAFAQEYECSFEATIRGSYFGQNIARLRASGRIKDFDYDPSYPVVTGWDIGFDGTVIWYSQKIGDEIRIIDVDVFEDKDIPYVVNKVMNKPYTYHVQILPHDAVKRLITDKRKTAKGQIENLGLKCKVSPRIPLEDGIHATRNLIDRAVFSKKCAKKIRMGRARISPIDSLSLYSAVYDDAVGVQQTKPKHDRHSHVADGLRTLATGIKNTITNQFEQMQELRKNPKKMKALVKTDWNPFARRGI